MAAAEAGEPRALLMVGTALYNGDGVTADPVKAYAYVSRAAAQGLAPAKATLADMDASCRWNSARRAWRWPRQMVARKAAGAAGPAPRPKPPKPSRLRPKSRCRSRDLSPHSTAPAKPAAVGSGRGGSSSAPSANASRPRPCSPSCRGKLAGKQAYYVPAGAVVRLQAGPFESRAGRIGRLRAD